MGDPAENILLDGGPRLLMALGSIDPLCRVVRGSSCDVRVELCAAPSGYPGKQCCKLCAHFRLWGRKHQSWVHDSGW